MRLIILFLMLTTIVFGQEMQMVYFMRPDLVAEEEQPPGSAIFPLNIIRGAEISHNQEYIVPDKYCAPNDYVGQVYYNCTDSVFNNGGETYTYAITSGNVNYAFKISTTGMLQVNDSSVINHATNYNLGITVSDTVGLDRSNTIYATVIILHKDSVYYVDFSGANGSGTFASPFNTLASVSLTAGYSALLKRGTTKDPSASWTVLNENNPTKWIRIGAYGQGARPVLDGGGTVTGHSIRIGDNYVENSSSILRTKKVAVYDLEFVDYTASSCDPVILTRAAQYIEIRRVKITGANGNGGIYVYPNSYTADRFNAYSLIEDVEVNSVTLGVGHAIKLEGGGVTIRNFWGSGSTSTGHFLHMSAWGANNKAYYIYSNNDGGDPITIRHSNCTLRWFVLRTTPTISIDQPGETQFHPDSTVISDGYIDGSDIYWDMGIKFGNDASGTGHSTGDTIRRIVFNYTGSSGMARGIRLTHSQATPIDDLIIEKCIFIGNWNEGIYSNSVLITDLKVQNNIFWGLNTYGVNLNNIGTGTKIWNNTAWDNGAGIDFNLGASTNVEFRNNSYVNRNSSSYWTPSTNNYQTGLGDPYVDKENGNFYPTVGSDIIDTGYTIPSITDDIVGTDRLPTVYDIGVYEYIP